MVRMRVACRKGLRWVCAVGAVLVLASPSWAQEADDPNPGAMTVSGGYDFLNRYMFRGIRQNSTELAMWPWVDLGVAAYSGDGALKGVSFNVGTWNSLHTGDTGSDGASGKLWYESDFYATLGFGFGGGTTFSTTYTAYTSPNGSFSTVKEVMFRLAVDDSGYLGRGAIKPYVAIAQEFSDEADGLTNGQADGGPQGGAGTYLEVGIGPGYSGSMASIAFPIKVGLSLSDYYQLAGKDNKFGYASVAGILTIPLGGTTRFGAWNIHGGVEYQKLGTTTEFFNGGDDDRVIYSGGFGFSY